VRYAKAVLNLVLERLSGAAGRGSGSFLGGLLNNPAVVGLGALALVFVFFGGDIRKAFGSFGENLGKIELPSISLPDITFPSIDLPDISNVFGGTGEAVGEGLGGAGEQVGGFFEGLTDQFNAFITGLGGQAEPEEQLPDIDRVLPPSVSEDSFISAEATVTVKRIADQMRDLSIPAAPSIAETIIAPFQGGGVSFEGGQIFETPIENLSLSQIIDRFMVTASQAADIRAQAIGFTPEEQEFLNLGQEVSPLGDITSAPQVSSPMFEGFTPEEISLRLTGGNISNFA